MKSKLIIFLEACLITLLILIVSGACRSNHFKSGTESGIKLDIVRFEKVLFSVDPSLIETYIPVWEQEYGDFFSNFCYITGLGNSGSSGFTEQLREFVTNRNNYLLYKRTMQVFPDLNDLTFALNNAFGNYVNYFPGKPVPRVITYISGLNQSAITDDSLLAIGLDKYLGIDEPLYRQGGIYSYLMVNMHPKKIVSDCMNFWGETEFAFNDSVNNLIAGMIYKGRLLYFTRAMLPDQPDSLNWGFSGEDLEYFYDSEKSMWAYFIENKLLFKTDRLTIDKFILEGPFTHDFGRESPARSAVWIGYRIIEAYMKKNPEISLQELMKQRDYLKILNQSSYNP